MSRNHFDNFIAIKNNFFTNPKKVISLFDHLEFYSSGNYPGKRTENLLESQNHNVKQFALFFVEKLCKEIFIGIHGFMIDVRFHINSTYDNHIANQGWIHADDTDLAGVVYLTSDEIDFEGGTSIFLKNNKEDFPVTDYVSRQEFNFTEKTTDNYLKDLENNHKNFTESVRVGNLYNRLIAYDSKLFHRPNRYNLLSGQARQSLVFFIKNYNVEVSERIKLNSKWEDL
jgi:Family of unknown function (DUF6445)